MQSAALHEPQRTWRCISGLGLFILALTFASAAAAAQINSWIQSTGGKWQETLSWSLGALPDSSQLVVITNAGEKTIEIDAGTVISHPESLTVEQLTISGQNTLLLRGPVIEVPLQLLPGSNVWNGLTLSNGGTLVNLDSRIVIGDSDAGLLRIAGGQVFQDGGIVEAPHTAYIYAGGHYCLTNGIFQSGFVDLPSGGRFH